MPGFIAQIDSAVQGLDLASLAGDTGQKLASLGQLVSQWSEHPPGDFGAALAGLGSIRPPQIELGADLGSTLGGLLPALQGELSGLAGGLKDQVGAMPTGLGGDITQALGSVLALVGHIQTLLSSDWTCGTVQSFAAPEAPAPAGGGGGGGGAGGTPPAATGALSDTQVAAAQATIATLPADLSVPSLLTWLHARIGTFRPDYFSVRSLPVIDDLRDPLDTLVRWDAAGAADLVAELTQTLTSLSALIERNTAGIFAQALPASAVAALSLAGVAANAEGYVSAVETLATAVQAKKSPGELASLVGDVQTAQEALAGAGAPLITAQAELAALADGLRGVAAALDQGICRLLVLLQPRATVADLIPGANGLPVPSLPADAFAPLSDLIQQVQSQLTHLLDQIDIAKVTGPLTAALQRADEALKQVEQGIAQLTALASEKLGQARSLVQSFDLDHIRQQAEQALAGAIAQVREAIAQALGPVVGALAQALQAADDALKDIDPEALTQPIRDAIDALAGVLQGDTVKSLEQILEGLKGLAGRLDQLSFAPVADEVIAAIGEVKGLIQSIDTASLPAPGPELISQALDVLPDSITPLTDPLIDALASQVGGAPTDLLRQVAALPGEARDRLLAFSPRQALEPLLVEPYRELVGKLEGFQPTQWLSAADQALADLRQQLLNALDIGALLRPLAQAQQALLSALEGFRPSTLIEPLQAALEQAAHAVGESLPTIDLGQALTGALARVRALTGTLDAALGVAASLSAKLGGLGDADAEFNAWVETILAKVPTSPSGALGTALDGVIAAAQGARPATLRTAWTSANHALADGLAAVAPQAKLARLLQARGRISGGLGALGLPDAHALPTWLAAAQTQAASQSLSRLAELASLSAAAGAAIELRLTEFGSLFPNPADPLAALLPGAADRALRDWLREAIRRQFGQPVIGLLKSLTLLGALLDTAVAALGALVQAIEDKLDAVLAAPEALAKVLGDVASLQQRLRSLDLGVYTREVDALYNDLLDRVRALEPRKLEASLKQALDQVLAQITVRSLLPDDLGNKLEGAYRDLVAKVGACDPEPLLIEPLDSAYRDSVLPLANALDIGDAVDKLIAWLNSLPEDLRGEIDRVDVAYRDLIGSAPGGGSGAAASVSASL